MASHWSLSVVVAVWAMLLLVNWRSCRFCHFARRLWLWSILVMFGPVTLPLVVDDPQPSVRRLFWRLTGCNPCFRDSGKTRLLFPLILDWKKIL